MNPDEVEDLLAGLSDEGEIDAGQSAERRSEPERGSPGRTVKIDNTKPDNSYSLSTDVEKTFAAVRHIYDERCAVLSELHFSADEYVQLVEILGNEPVIDAALQARLVEAIGSDRTTRLCIAFSNSRAQELARPVYESVFPQLAHLSVLLYEKREMLARLTENAESELPNLTALTSPRTAALLLLKFGSIDQLAVMPAANLVTNSPLSQDKLIAEVPDKYKRQALRILAGKTVLAARLDSQSGAAGSNAAASAISWRRNVEHRISKLLAPPLAIQERALPKPVDKKSKRRGGKRVRMQKQKRAAAVKPEFVKFGDL